jgi:short-subunit dehydrogenase
MALPRHGGFSASGDTIRLTYRQIPMLTRTSTAPAILLVSSMAALVPAPTRALYAATKASSLLLYQALSIEHRDIAFTFVLPATIEGDFRASAVDSGPVREADPNKHGLKIDYVAQRCIDAVDRGVRGSVIMPWVPYAFAHHLYYIWPSLVERLAARKYNFQF